LAQVGLRDGSDVDMMMTHVDLQNYSRTYKWLTEAACKDREVLMRAPADGAEVSSLVHAPVAFSEADLQSFLEANHVDGSKLSVDEAKTLRNFSDELVRGEAQLTRKLDGTITRLVDVVILQISRKNGDVLVALTPEDSKAAGRLPAVKRRPDENPFWAAKRVLSKELKICENLVKVDPSSVLFTEEETVSKKYLGLPTIYRRLIIPATIEEN